MDQKIDKENISDIVGLSSLQQGLMFHYLENPSTEAYCEKVCIEFTGKLDLQRFRWVWECITQTHDALRTLFRWERIQNPVQIVLKEKPLDLTLLSMEDYPTPESKRAFVEAATIDPQISPFRLILFHGPEEHHCWFIYSHILLDGWSLSLIVREFLTRYRENDYPAEGGRRTQFKEYVKWLQQTPKKDHQNYWAALLRNHEAIKTLLPDQLTQNRSGKCRALSCPMDEELLRKIEAFFKTKGVALSSLIYFSWSYLLYRYSNAKEVTFGISLSHRHLPLDNLEQTVGLLINTIPMRVAFEPHQRIEDLILSIHQQFIQSQDHSVLSLIEMQQAGGLDSRVELFDTILAIENYPLYDSLAKKRGALSVSKFYNTEHTHYPLTLILDLLGKPCLKISYRENHFSEPWIKQIADHFFRILAEVVSGERLSVQEINLTSEEEKARLLEWGHNTQTPYPHEETIPSLFRKEAEMRPDKEAVVGPGDNSLTYKKLDDLSEAIQEKLTSFGVGHEEIVGVRQPKGGLMVASLLGILKAGAVYIPINPKLPVSRQNLIVEDCDIHLILEVQDGEVVFTQVKERKKGPLSPKKEPGPLDLAYILHSSGSTGRPKEIMIPHRGVVRLVKNTNYISLSDQDRWLWTTSLEFDVSVMEIWGAMLNGVTLYVVEEADLLDIQRMKTYLAQQNINKIWLSTPLMNMWANEDVKLFEGIDYLIAGGDVLSPPHIRKIQEANPRIKIVNGYGPTENSVISTYFEVERQDYRKIPIGKPNSNATIYIVNAAGDLQPIGAVGELWLGGDGVGRGYLNQPELTEAKFIDNPFGEGRIFKSGDLGRWLPDGTIDFIGRNDFQIKVRGHRIEINEVELAIKSHPSVKEAVVVAAALPSGDKEMVAYVHHEERLSLSDLKTYLERALPKYAIPSKLLSVTSFPMIASGKIDRVMLAKESVKRFEEEVAQEKRGEPLSKIEETLIDIYRKTLQKSEISIHDNFFDIGGNSLHTITLKSVIQKVLHRDIPVTDIFQYPTIALLAKHFESQETGEQKVSLPQRQRERDDLAIVGISCRFPGAPSKEDFWDNLCSERSSIRKITKDELLDEGIPMAVATQENYVPFKGVLEGVEAFDHHFFGYSARDAELMDPQLRLLHECCWDVLEDSGYIPEECEERIGLFVGGEGNVLWTNALLRELSQSTERWQAAHYNLNSLSTQISYKLRLTGPSMTIDTACSSSLVALHQAKNSLWAGECDIAIAGGVSIELPKKGGYLYEEGMILSKDGKCAAFDASATGTVSGDGVGLVVLKPLQKALKDGDRIYAVVKGSAVNNDGARKVGYTAPSIDGQTEVIRMALNDAELPPEQISYIEAHGTGTKLGDPIEIKALGRVYTSQNSSRIPIGSVKTNIGHLNTASGIAGFIKTTLALYHRYLPATLNYHHENPECHFEQTPFHVIAKGESWRGKEPRYAAVSSFGIGGTNAHMILGEWRGSEATTATPSQRVHVALLSARSETALRRQIRALKEVIVKQRWAVEDLCYTLQVHRKHFEYRTSFLCSAETHWDSEPSIQKVGDVPPKIAFIFPGQGGAGVKVEKSLYETFPIIKECWDRGFRFLKNHYGFDFAPAFFSGAQNQFLALGLNQTQGTQLTLFLYGYALATFLRDLGALPSAFLGHSVGEYVAAALAGVFSLEEGVRLLVERGRIMGHLPEGKMLAMRADLDTIEALLKKAPGVTLAAYNSPEDFVVAGDEAAITHLSSLAKKRGVAAVPLQTSIAFHSRDINAIREELYALFSGADLQRPREPFVSTFTGSWVEGHEVTEPHFWLAHSLEKVRFAEGMERLKESKIGLFVELSPARILTPLISRQLSRTTPSSAICSSAHPSEHRAAQEVVLALLQHLWLKGITLKWKQLYTVRPKRAELPRYSFDKQVFWKYGKFLPSVEAAHAQPPAQESTPHFLVPKWEAVQWAFTSRHDQVIWFFHHGADFDRHLMQKVQSEGRFFACDLNQIKENKDIIAWCAQQPEKPDQVLLSICESLPPPQEVDEPHFNEQANRYFYPFLEMVHYLGAIDLPKPTLIRVVGNGVLSMADETSLDPAKALLLPLLKSVQVEYAQFLSQFIDIGPAVDCYERAIDLIQEKATLLNPTLYPELAIRSHGTFRLRYGPLSHSSSPSNDLFKREGVYLLTGGLGGLGLVMASFLAERYQARLILVGRSGEEKGITSQKKSHLLSMIKQKALSVEIEKVDMGAPSDVLDVLQKIHLKYGTIDGILHLAGLPDEGLLQTKKRADFEKVFRPKILGSIHLIQALKTLPGSIGFVLFGSSIASATIDYGQSAYVAANYFLNALAQKCRLNGLGSVLSVNWDSWAEIGMAKRYIDQVAQGHCLVRKTLTLDPQSDWVLQEHRIDQQAVLPGAYFLALLVQETIALGYTFPLAISSIQFSRPFIVREEEAGQLEISLWLLPDKAETVAFSLKQLTHVGSIVVCEGTLLAQPTLREIPYLDSRKSKKQQTLIFPPPQSVKQGHSPMVFGPRWNSVRKITYDHPGEVIAHLILPDDYQRDLEKYLIHPALLDSSLSCLLDVFFPDLSVLPIAFRGVVVHRPFTSHLYCKATLQQPYEELTKRDHFSLQVEIFDQDECCCLECYVDFKSVDQSQQEATNTSLFIEKPGDLSTLCYKPSPRPQLQNDEVEIEAVATGLNFKEVLYGLGVIPLSSSEISYAFGLEVAGVVTQVGSNVRRFKPGDGVMGMVSGGFNRYVCAKESQLIAKPHQLSFEEAATHTVSYLTAYQSLIKNAGLTASDKILIHSAASGVGLAAVEIAKAIGAEIYATAGSQEKRDILLAKGVKGVFDSRTTEFITAILEMTGDYGVDVLLNSLSGKGLLGSLELVAPYGRFLELGIRDMYEETPLNMRLFSKGFSFIPISISPYMPHYLSTYQEVIDGLAKGKWPRLPLSSFDREETTSAFALMAGAKHVGKVAVLHKKPSELLLLNQRYGRGEAHRHYALTNQEGVDTLVRAAALLHTDFSPSAVYVTKRETIQAILGNSSADQKGASQPLPAHKKRRPTLASNYAPASNGVEQTLVEILEEFLGIHGIGVEDNFTELGMTSLDIIQVKSLVSRRFDVDISVVQFYSHSTVTALSRLIEQNSAQKASHFEV